MFRSDNAPPPAPAYTENSIFAGTVAQATGQQGWLARCPYYNLTQFGAIAGSPRHASVNKAALKNAFAAVSAAGFGTIIIPDGDFYVNCSYTEHIINVPSNCAILMGKSTRMIVSLGGDSNTHVMFRINRASNVWIHGGEIIGDAAARGAGSGIAILGVGERMSSNILVENVVCRGLKEDGFYVEDGTSLTFRKCEAYNCGRTGAVVTRGSKIRFLGCEFSSTRAGVVGAGLNVETQGADDVTDIFVDHCTFASNASQGIYCHQGSGSGIPKRITLSNTQLLFNGSSQVQFSASAAVTIIDTHFFGTGRQDNLYLSAVKGALIERVQIVGGNKGVYLLASSHVEVRCSHIKDTADSAIATLDNNPASPLYANEVDSCTIENSGEHAIDWRGDTGRVTNNIINRAQKNGIRTSAGTNNYIGFNQVRDTGLSNGKAWPEIADLGAQTIVVANQVWNSRVRPSGTAQ